MIMRGNQACTLNLIIPQELVQTCPEVIDRSTECRDITEILFNTPTILHRQNNKQNQIKKISTKQIISDNDNNKTTTKATTKRTRL